MRKRIYIRAAWALGLMLAGGGACGPHPHPDDIDEGDCSDGVENGYETDIDCGGGSCPVCPEAAQCFIESDCGELDCIGGICQATCFDDLKNGGETDVDCGSGCPKDCASGKGCSMNADCASDACVGGVCVDCYNETCGEYIAFEPAGGWCDDYPEFTPGMTNPSYAMFSALAVCTCGHPMNPGLGGKCATPCMNETCAGKELMSAGECQMCIVDTVAGCGNEFNACASDF